MAEETEGFRGLGLAFLFPIDSWDLGGVFNATRKALSRRRAISCSLYWSPGSVLFVAMVDTALRIRVQRLLRDDFRVEDLTTIFLAMRDRCGGRETVREIGDFVAHRDERTKGITTRSVRDFFVVLRFMTQYSFAGIALKITDLPSNIKDVLWATFRRIGNDLLKKHTGLKRAAAERQLIEIGGRLLSNADGSIYLAWPTQDDFKLLTCLTSFIIAKPAFDDITLFDELCASLNANGLLEKKEMRSFSACKKMIAVYAVSSMHGCIVDLGNGTKAELYASAEGDGLLHVIAIAVAGVIPGSTGGPVHFAGSMFNTSFLASDCCDQDLFRIKSPIWKSYHLELAPDGKLSILT